MRKSTKLAILVAALVALCSLAAFAADTWKQDGDNWYCYDKDGNLICGEWRKSGENYYYLDAGTGAMVKDTLVESDGYKYWVGSDGARVINQWVKVPVENDDDGWEWMYFQTVNGKAKVGTGSYGTTTINSKKYQFSADGYMLYGYLDESLTKWDYPSAAAYYFGTKEDGSAQTGWIKITDGSDANYSDSSLVYFYFKNGVKQVDKSLTVNSKKYWFKSDGKLVTGWWATPTVADGKYAYFGGSDDGTLKKSQWISSTNDFGDGEDGDTSYWYYLGSNGARYGEGAGADGVVKKISGKYYLFNQYCHMVSGVVRGTTTDATVSTSFKYAGGFSTLSQYKAYGDNAGDPAPGSYAIMYFSADSTDGSMKTGTQTITIDGEEAEVYFDKHGYAVEGISSKKIYKNGILQSAGSDKVAVKKLRVATAGYYGYNNYFLVNASGAILKNSKQVDADGIYWVTTGDYSTANGGYTIFRIKDTENASYAATAVKNGKDSFKVSSTTYYIHKDAATTDKYVNIYWDTTAEN